MTSSVPIQKYQPTLYLKRIFKNENLFQDIATNKLTLSNILNDIMLNCLEFVVDQGLVEWRIEIFLKSFYQFLNDTVLKALAINDAIEIFKSHMKSLARSGHFKEPFLKASIQYISQNILQHYHLIVYVFSNEQEVQLHTSEPLVEVISTAFTPLSLATPIEMWEAEERLRLEETKLHQNREELNKTVYDSTKILEDDLESCLKTLEELSLETLTVSDIKKLIEAIVEKHGDIVAVELNGIIARSMHTIGYQFEKTKVIQKLKNSSVGKSSTMLLNQNYEKS